MQGNVADRLKEILSNAKWTHERLAQELNVPVRTIYTWVNNKATPRDANLDKITALYLDIVGRTDVTDELLAQTKANALSKHMDVRELVTNKELLDLITLYLTYHTNSIEGSTMTVDDVRTVLDDDMAVLPNRTVKEQLEARNHRSALDYLINELATKGDNFKWTIDLVLQTHLRLMNGIISDAGMFRQYGVRIIGASTPRVNPASVPAKMMELIEVMNTPTDDLIAQLAKTHATYELIHPFGDGNGRTGRLFMFIQALQYHTTPPLVIKERKRAYYRYLDKADKTQDYRLLELFIAESIVLADELISSGGR